jgi:hypothetical protein
VLHLRIIIFFSERHNVFVDSETFLMTDFVNLKIRAAQFFRDAHRERVRVFIRVSGSYVYDYICLNCFSNKIRIQ